ncbi:ankyrin repeat domain-containing protein 26 isoform X2 [Cricetulus griseus]|uniref:Ankyrin repeat domain-containing protein 26 isoform X2 n=1 Tax=Cricetulus griseus TaxID=10029 RepID=A0A9J7JZZ3_CRIGR|nr:ankyrin repeat domain-containing protein 26 isoform X2 [Cricetulus griseus]
MHESTREPATLALGFNTDPGCSRVTDPDMALSCGSGTDITLALGSSTDHVDLHGPDCSMALGHQHGHRWLTHAMLTLVKYIHLSEEPGNEVAPTEERKGHEDHQSVQSWTTSETATYMENEVPFSVTPDQILENMANAETEAKPDKEVTSTEGQTRHYNSEGVNSVLLGKEDACHLAAPIEQRSENVTNGEMEAATAASPKDEEDDAAATAASPKDEEDDDAAAAATSNNGIRHEFIIQRHFGKAGNHQFPVTTKKHVGLNEKICDEKNKAVEHLDAIDDHQLSQSASEDDILPDYDNILMIVDQLQMNYKDSGRLLEIQDAVHSYKMILEHKQSHSELLTEKSKKMKIGASEMLKKPRETEKAKSQLRCKNEEQQLELIGVGLAGKQEEQQRNAHYLHEEIKKQLTEKEEQHKKEKQQLEMCLKAQDTELRHLRNHMKKLQEARDQETQAEESDRMMKEHLQKVEQEIFKLEETVKKQAETIEQLEKKLSKDKSLVRFHNLMQTGQEFVNNFREMYTTSVMRQLEFRIQSLESKISEMKMETYNDVLALENCNELHQSHKLRETEDQLKEVMTQFRMVTQHNMSLLNVLASECPCVANFHKCLGNLFTQENMVTPNMLTPTSRPQSSKQYRTANLDVSADNNEDFNKEPIKLVLCPRPELDHTKKKSMESAKEKTLSKKCFKRTKTTECENGKHSFSEVSNTRQFEMESPIDLPRHERTAEDEETVDSTLENHDASFISLQESRFTNLQSEHSEKTTHQGSYKAESKKCKDPYLERVKMTKRSSRKQLRSKDRQEEAMRKIFKKMEPYSSAPNMSTTSPAPGFAVELLNNGWEHSSFVGREPLIQSSRPQPFAESLASFLNREREENQQTFDDRRGKHKASYMRPQEPKITNLKPKHPEELAHQTSHKAEPNQYEELYLEMIEMTKSLSHEQLKSKDRQDEAMRKNFEKTELYRSAPNTYMTSPVQGVAAGHPHSSQEHGGNFIQGEPFVTGSSPWHFVESLDNYLCRVSYAIHFDYGFRHLL